MPRPVPEPLILGDIPAGSLDALETRAQRLAFWINAYNGLVARGLVALGVGGTVWEVPGFFDRIGCRAGDLVVSANDIEHGILRGNRPGPLATTEPFPDGDPRRRHALTPVDPRVHFAISCGARSCPAVRTYDALDLDAQLDAATRAFVTLEVTLEGARLTASRIFDWFRTDFAEQPGGLTGFLLCYLDDGPARRAVLEGGLAAVAWRPYDWRIQPPALPSQPAIRWTVPA